MTEKQFFVEILKTELPRFERVMKAVEAVPKQKHSYKHDKKSRTTLELMLNAFGSESGMFPVILKTGKLDFLGYAAPKMETVGDVRKEFVKNMKMTEKLVSKMNEKVWASKAQMYMGSKMVWEAPRGKIIWEFLLDLIHHRGQLSTHLRPMGGKVPSIYGPSADSGM